MKTISAELQQHFDFLGITPQTDTKQAKQAYLKSAMKWHPDRFSNDSSQSHDKEYANAQFSKLNAAYHQVELYLKQNQGFITLETEKNKYTFHTEEKPVSIINYRHEITLKQSIYGSQELVHIPMELTCPTCYGLGAMGAVTTCPQCKNVGKINETHILSLQTPAVKDVAHKVSNTFTIEQPERINNENYLFKIEYVIALLKPPFYQIGQHIHLHVVIKQSIFDDFLINKKMIHFLNPIGKTGEEVVNIKTEEILEKNFLTQITLEAGYTLNIHFCVEMKPSKKNEKSSIFGFWHKEDAPKETMYVFPNSPLTSLNPLVYLIDS